MFTGIIEDVGTVGRAEPAGDSGGGRHLTIAASFAPELAVDQSVSVDGACQTVVAAGDETFQVVTIEETLRKTTLGALEAGDRVNLERAMTPGGRFDGHFVQGHVDAAGTVARVEQEDTDRLVSVRFPERFAPNLIETGSVCIDGVSLTVARLDDELLTVALIPHTLQQTTADEWSEGASVNLEFDLLGKYVARRLSESGSTRERGHGGS